MTTATKTKTTRVRIDGDEGLALVNMMRLQSGQDELTPAQWSARRKASRRAKASTEAPRVRRAKMPKTSTSKRPKTRREAREASLDTDNTDFGRILRRALKASDQTLYRVSMETDIGQDVLSRFVREERGLSLETAGRLAVHLGYQLKRG